MAFPDERQTAKALRRLDLLVQVDPWMSQTASFADYVIAPKMTPEMTGTTAKAESAMQSYATGYGFQDAYAQVSEAVVQPPPGSDVVEDWEVFFGLAQRMGLQLNVAPVQGPAIALDMSRPPEPADLVAMLYTGSRVPLDEVAGRPHGGFFPSPVPLVVAPKDPGWTGRLDVGNPEMLADLTRAALPDGDGDGSYPWRLLNRRMMHVVNSSYNERALTGHRAYNPAYLHPDDLAALGLRPGDAVIIRSAHSEVDAIVEADGGLRPGTVSISFGFGHPAGGSVKDSGSNVARLLSTSDLPDPYSGQPRMSNVPVQIVPCRA
jgi:anaerobic selenocysteine-containing dehydrogenase